MKENFDKGWAWVILTVSFLSRMNTASLVFSTGVMNVALLEYFERSVAATAIFGSVLLSAVYFVGPVASLIINRFGCRVAHMVGTSLSFIGFISGFFVTSLEPFIFTYGLLGGAGIGINYVNDIVILSFHFKKYLGLSVGITTAGSGIGIFISGPLIQYLLDTYGLNGTCLVVSGMILNEVVFGSLMFPTYGERVNKIVKTTSKTITPVDDVAGRNNQIISKTTTDGENIEKSDNTEKNNVMEKDKKLLCCQILQIAILKNKAYVVLLVCDFLWTIPYAILIYHLPNFTVKLGSTPEQGALLITAMGVGGTINRFITGLSLGPGGLDPLLLFLGFNGILGAVTLTFPLYFTSYITHIIYSCLFGMYTGGLVAMKNPLCMNIVGIHYLSTGIGLFHLVEGLAYLGSPPIAGLIYDNTGSYEYSFYLSGSMFIMTFLLSLLASVWRKEQTIEKDLEFEQTDSRLETISENVSTIDLTVTQQGDIVKLGKSENEFKTSNDYMSSKVDQIKTTGKFVGQTESTSRSSNSPEKDEMDTIFITAL